MVYLKVSSLLLVSLSHIFLLPISASPEKIQDPHHESTQTSTWHCYKDEFARDASPFGHSLQAPCLRFIPTSPANVTIADGTEVHPVRVQVAPGLVSAANILLRWTLIVSATQQGRRSESYPVQQCRNKISCDIHLPATVFSHGKPVVMVTGSYQRTPWMKTILNVSLQEQDKSEALLLVPRQARQYQASQQVITQQPSQKTPHQSRKHKGRPSDLHSSTQWLERIGPRNSLKDLGTQVPQVSTVRRVRRGRNNPPSQQDVRTSSAAFRRTGKTPKERISADTLPRGGENVIRLQNHSRRKNRGRPSEKVGSVSRKTRLIRQKQSSRSRNAQETHNKAVSRSFGDLPLSQRQSSRHLPQRRDNRQVRRARAFGYQSRGQESRGTVRRYAVPGTRQRNRKEKSADIRSYQTGIQPLQSWQRPSEHSGSSYPLKGHSAYPIQNSPPWTQQNYRQRIKSEFHALQNLQSNLHHRGKRVHQRHKKNKKQKEKGLHNVGLLQELQDLRADYLTRLNLLSPGENLPHRSSPPRQKYKELTKTPKRFTKIAKKPQRIIPNYYPIIPPRRVKQERVTTVPTVAAVMTTTVNTTTAAPAANLTTKAGMTTFGSSPIGGRPIGGRPMSNLERMRNDRMMYQGLGRNYQQGDPNNARKAVNHRWRDSSASGRVWNTFTEDGTIPRRPQVKTVPKESGFWVAKTGEGLSDQASVDIPEGAEDGETDFRGTFPKTSQYEDYPIGFGQKTKDSGNRLGIVSSDPQSNEEQQSNTPRRDNSQDDAKELNRQDTWTEYSGLLPADYDEIEEDAFKDTGGTEDIYDNGVSVDTWGELKSNLTKPVRSIVDLLNRRMSMDDDSMPKPFTPDKYRRELDMPFNEKTFRALQEEIINEEGKEPEKRHSAEESYLGHNILQQRKYSASPPRPSAFGSNAGKQSAPVRSSRTVNKDIAFETSASEPMEYSYNPSSDLSELGTAVSDAMQDTDGRSLDEETFLATREKILQEERVGPGQRANGRQSTHGLSRKVSGREEIRNSPLGHRDHIGSITVTNRNYALLSNDQTGWEVQQNVDINHQDSIPQDLGPIENSAAETTEDRPSALQAGLNPGSVGTKETDEDYFGYNPVSEEDKVPERLESQSYEWSEWSQCSHSCGHGTKTRHRACTGPDTSNCVSGVESHALQCALQRCSEDWEGAALEMTEEPLSQWRDWSGWSVCSVSCGRGLSRRERTCLDQELGCTGQKTETRTCQLEDCFSDWNGAISERGTIRRSDYGHHHHSHHTKRIKCHLDENRSQLPMELYWTSPSGEKITHAMTHEKNSKYHIEGTTLVVHEDQPTEGSYHCIVIYGGSSGSHNKEKAGPTGACLSHPCHHKGVCLDQPGPNNVSYRCLCPAGYEGMTCHMAPYLKGDVVVLSLLGWFVVSSTVIILIICFCCSKQMKKKKMKQRLELDDAPAEKLLAKILPHIDTTHKIESDTEEDIKPLLDFRPPQVTTKPPLKSTLSKEPVEMTRQPAKVRFKNLVKKVSTTPKKVEGVAFPTLKQIKSLTEEFKAQRNQNNSNKLDSNESDDNSLSSYTTLSSSCGSIHEEDNGEECEEMVNQNMNNCSWDYSSVSSCAPFDLNSSSIVGNDDDSLLEISTEDFRDFQVASAFSVFRGSPSLKGKQAVIAPSLVNENSNAIPACSPSLPSEVPRGSERHPMYHFDPTDHHSTYMSSSTIERLNNSDIGLGSASGTRPWRTERPWSMTTPTQRGNGVRVRLPPSPPLSVSPSRLPLPPSPMGQGEPRMFGQAEERAILEQYRERRTTHPRNAKSDMSFSMSPQDVQHAATSAAGMEPGLPQERRQSSP